MQEASSHGLLSSQVDNLLVVPVYVVFYEPPKVIMCVRNFGGREMADQWMRIAHRQSILRGEVAGAQDV